MMITSLKQPTISFPSSNLLRQRFQILSSQIAAFTSRNPDFPISKPLRFSEIKGFGLINGLRERTPLVKCEAYEADRSEHVDPEVVGSSEAANTVKIGVYFATWWALNVVFNIYNRKVLNAFPYPWLTSTLSLATGSLMMLVSWATGIVEPPITDFDFWKTLFPVAVAHTIGHVAATVSMSKVAVSFTHIIKSGDPAFSVLVSRLLLGETFPAGVYWSLLPIIGGCALAAVTRAPASATQ